MSLENIELPRSVPQTAHPTAPGPAITSVPKTVRSEIPKPEAEVDVEMTMSVSPVCVKDGKQYAFVTFVLGEKMAEGRIPECQMISNKGFSSEEVEKLERYMKRELTSLKKMASSVNVLGAFMK
ncbi:MAG: hypothetical protein IJY10_07770 [Lachnospiraceae bacterium]|nr:hypothetical protein [Lachnospiraceae bacterium]